MLHEESMRKRLAQAERARREKEQARARMLAAAAAAGGAQGPAGSAAAGESDEEAAREPGICVICLENKVRQGSTSVGRLLKPIYSYKSKAADRGKSNP